MSSFPIGSRFTSRTDRNFPNVGFPMKCRLTACFDKVVVPRCVEGNWNLRLEFKNTNQVSSGFPALTVFSHSHGRIERTETNGAVAILASERSRWCRQNAGFGWDGPAKSSNSPCRRILLNTLVTDSMFASVQCPLSVRTAHARASMCGSGIR